MLSAWEEVRAWAAATREHSAILSQDPSATLGLWQIQEEVNVKVPSGKKKPDGTDDLVRKYPILNTKINVLDGLLKAYYQEHLVADLFKYELLK